MIVSHLYARAAVCAWYWWDRGEVPSPSRRVWQHVVTMREVLCCTVRPPARHCWGPVSAPDRCVCGRAGERLVLTKTTLHDAVFHSAFPECFRACRDEARHHAVDRFLDLDCVHERVLASHHS